MVSVLSVLSGCEDNLTAVRDAKSGTVGLECGARKGI